MTILLSGLFAPEGGLIGKIDEDPRSHTTAMSIQLKRPMFADTLESRRAQLAKQDCDRTSWRKSASEIKADRENETEREVDSSCTLCAHATC